MKPSRAEVDKLHLKYHRHRHDADKEALFQIHQGFAASVAARYVAPHFTYDESLNAALIGLWDALSRYTPERGRFTTFSFFWMLKHILREKGFNKHCVKPPSGDLKKNRRIRGAQQEGLSDEAIAMMMGITVEEFHRLETMHENPGNEEIDPLAALVCEDETPAEALCRTPSRREILKDRLALAMQNLSSRERLVVKGRHEDPPRSFESLGKALGLTGEAARKLFLKAMTKLRKIS